MPWSEIRKNSLVRQGWDKSCGAAALSTILTYFHNQPVSELAITLTLLKNTDPSIVRERGGFSLLDLKRYAKATGYSAYGFGSMTLDDIDQFKAPAILPVRIRNFDHFVVFRERIGDRVLLGDPAFGNITLNLKEFDAIWQSRIAFYVLEKGMGDKLLAGGYSGSVSALTGQMMELAIPNLNYTYRVINTMPMNPATRRSIKIIQ